MNKNFYITCLITAAFVAVFFSIPSLDIIVSSWFFDKESGFYLSENFIVKNIGLFVKAIALFFVVWSVNRARKIYAVHALDFWSYKDLMFVTSFILLAPGLIVHEVIKDIFNRPRPRQIVDFGGEHLFVPVLHAAEKCEDCYSFVSGHTSLAFSLIAISVCYHGFARKVIFSLSLCIGLLVGLVRIAGGYHFLSDVIFAGCFTYLLFFIALKCFKYQ